MSTVLDETAGAQFWGPAVLLQSVLVGGSKPPVTLTVWKRFTFRNCAKICVAMCVCRGHQGPAQSRSDGKRRFAAAKTERPRSQFTRIPAMAIVLLCSAGTCSAFRLPSAVPLVPNPMSLYKAQRTLLQHRNNVRTPLLRMCSEPAQEVADDIGFGDYISKLPDRLVEHLQTSTGDLDAREQTRRYIIELEQLQNYPLDPSFHNFAVSGEWQLLYSTSRISAPDTNLKLRSIRSKWDATLGKIVHDVAWDFTEEEDFHTSGTFQIITNFTYGDTPSMPARSHLAVDAFELTPTPLNRPPKDPQALVSALQRALPKEYFDPDGAVLDTTYLNPNVRIVCFLGMRFAGVRHVYSRVLPQPEDE